MEVKFESGAAAQLESYVISRRAAGAMCDGYVGTLRRFDAVCADLFPDDGLLTQRMVDLWCAKRETESANSCRARSYPVVSLVKFLRERGETDVVAPELPRKQETGYVPHAFTEDELGRFFAECDAYRPRKGARETIALNALMIPVLFRLLYSSGMRPCEARLLKCESVDLAEGVLRIVDGKGKNQRIVALHPSMAEIMRSYDEAMGAAVPGRVYFFPNGVGGHLRNRWVSERFRTIWARVSDEPATAPQLRHHYATESINALVGEGLGGLAGMEYLSKSMGHASIEETVASYCHIVPSLAEALQACCSDAFDGIVPEVM